MKNQKFDKKRKFSKKGKKDEPQIFSRQDRKRIRLERRHARPHGEIVTATNNQVWGKGDAINSMESSVREAKIEQILSLVDGKMAKIATKHDVSRSLQVCVKHGTAAQRQRVFDEIKKSLVELTKNRYGHHVVIKLFQLGGDSIKAAVREQLTGNMRKLSFRNDSAKVMDLLYASGTPQQQHRLLCEFYGPEFLLKLSTDQAIPSLASVMKETTSRATVLETLRAVIAKLINKEMLMFRFAHSLLKSYFKYASQDQRSELIPELMPYPLALYHTATGANVLCTCIAEGGAKARKVMLKAIKGRVIDMASDPFGHTALVRVLLATDDTVLLGKAVLAEFIAPSGELREEVLLSPYVIRVLLQILSPGDSRHFAKAQDKALVATPTIMREGEDGKTVAMPTVKKSLQQRQTELLKKLLPALVKSFMAEDAETLEQRIKRKNESRLLYETLIQCSAQSMCSSDFPQLCNSIGEVAAQEGLLEDLTGHIFYKRLLLNLAEPAPLVASMTGALLEDAKTYALTNRGAFVVMALMRAGGAATTDSFVQALTPSLKAIKAAKRPGTNHLARALQDPSTLQATPTHPSAPAKGKTAGKRKRKPTDNSLRSTEDETATEALVKKVKKQEKAKKARQAAAPEDTPKLKKSKKSKSKSKSKSKKAKTRTA